MTAAQIVELAPHAPKAALDSEVGDGLITQSEADNRLADLKAHVADAPFSYRDDIADDTAPMSSIYCRGILCVPGSEYAEYGHI